MNKLKVLYPVEGLEGHLLVGYNAFHCLNFTADEARYLTEQLLKLGFGPDSAAAEHVAKALRLMEVFEHLCAIECDCRPSTGCPESCEDCDWLNGVQQQLRAALEG